MTHPKTGLGIPVRVRVEAKIDIAELNIGFQ
jgi:hypothetical protein